MIKQYKIGDVLFLIDVTNKALLEVSKGVRECNNIRECDFAYTQLVDLDLRLSNVTEIDQGALEGTNSAKITKLYYISDSELGLVLN